MQKEHKFYRVLYAFSEQVLAYSYAVQNLTNIDLEITLDLSRSVSMVSSSRSHQRNHSGETDKDVVTKAVMPGQTTFFCHQMVDH